MLRTALIAVVAVALVIPAAAQAHVTLQPKTATAGGYTRLDVRVPNERDDAATAKVEVQFPDGFASASYEPVPGWSVEVTRGKLVTPIQTDDGEVTEGVKRITWTADSERDAIPPGAFQDFGLSLRMPDKPGDLTFKALQTYSGGEVVRWIGAEDSDNPAPIVSVTAGTAEDSGHEATPAPTEAASATTSGGQDGGVDGLAIAALIVGVVGLAVGAAGFVTARRASGGYAGTP